MLWAAYAFSSRLKTLSTPAARTHATVALVQRQTEVRSDLLRQRDGLGQQAAWFLSEPQDVTRLCKWLSSTAPWDPKTKGTLRAPEVGRQDPCAVLEDMW